MRNIDDIPKDPGSYALIIALSKSHTLQVGRLGECNFLPGNYMYLGSARGAGGIKGRLGRHLRAGKRMHWHIDYLRAVGDVAAFFYHIDRINISPLINVECAWSQTMAALPGVSIPVAGFGASDCRAGCPAHLLALPGPLCSIERYRENLALGVGRHPQEIVWVAVDHKF